MACQNVTFTFERAKTLKTTIKRTRTFFTEIPPFLSFHHNELYRIGYNLSVKKPQGSEG
jgi:hypothetical protein